MDVTGDQETTDLPFPGLGVHKAGEFGTQPVGTTPAAANARLYEALSRRGRGGSRCGLSKYAADRVGGLNSPVQNLALVVSTDGAATLAAQDPFQTLASPAAVFDPSTNNRANGNPGVPGPPGETGGPPFATPGGGPTGGDPSFEDAVRNEGRKVRPGGSGVQPTRHYPPTLPDGSAVTPGRTYVVPAAVQYHPDNVPYVFQLNLGGGVIGFAVGDGTTADNPTLVALRAGALVEVGGAVTAAGFGVTAGLPVVTVVGD